MLRNLILSVFELFCWLMCFLSSTTCALQNPHAADFASQSLQRVESWNFGSMPMYNWQRALLSDIRPNRETTPRPSTTYSSPALFALFIFINVCVVLLLKFTVSSEMFRSLLESLKKSLTKTLTSDFTMRNIDVLVLFVWEDSIIW